jgi:hypothetical protein
LDLIDVLLFPFGEGWQRYFCRDYGTLSLTLIKSQPRFISCYAARLVSMAEAGSGPVGLRVRKNTVTVISDYLASVLAAEDSAMDRAEGQASARGQVVVGQVVPVGRVSERSPCSANACKVREFRFQVNAIFGLDPHGTPDSP